MAYKYKPNKSVAKRFKVTRTGKLKRHHAYTSHLKSARTPAKLRTLRQAAILFEGHAKNMRRLIGVEAVRPGQIRHKRALKAKAAEKAAKKA